MEVEEVIYNLTIKKGGPHLNNHVRGMDCWCKPTRTDIKDEDVVVGYRITHRNYELKDGQWVMLLN
jgi:hypothetical protein